MYTKYTKILFSKPLSSVVPVYGIRLIQYRHLDFAEMGTLSTAGSYRSEVPESSMCLSLIPTDHGFEPNSLCSLSEGYLHFNKGF